MAVNRAKIAVALLIWGAVDFGGEWLFNNRPESTCAVIHDINVALGLEHHATQDGNVVLANNK